MRYSLLFGAVLSCFFCFGVVAAEGGGRGSLLPNGGFELDRNSDGQPDGWNIGEGVQWAREEGNRFLRLQPTEPGQMVMSHRALDLPSGVGALELSYRVRYTDLKPGEEAWHDGRIVMHFLDAAGRQLSPDPSHPNFRGSSDGWVQRRQRLTVPEGARTLEFMPAVFKAAGGRLDLDDIEIKPVGAQAAAGPRKAESTQAQEEPMTQPAPNAEPPPELHVEGNRLLTPKGEEVWLQGVNVPSLEWTPTGEHVLRSIRVAVEDWRANVIRLPVSEEYWFGRGEHQGDDGGPYRRLIDDAVAEAAGRGAYVVIDLHRYRAPTRRHAEFWAEAAARYAGNPAVLFGLLNEPHGISWEVWRDGGPVERKTQDGETETFESVGMQGLVDTVRDAGAQNIVVVGGLDWAYDLSGVLGGYALDDRGGNGIIYDSHVYNWKRDWREKFLAVAEEHPVLIGETGCAAEPLHFIPAENQEDPYTWAPAMIGLVQKHRLHWTAWSFHTGASPSILADWDYTPTPHWGAFVRAGLRGAGFRVERLR